MLTGYPEIQVRVKPENMPWYQVICLILVKRHQYPEAGDPVPYFLQIVICLADSIKFNVPAMKAEVSRLLHRNLLK